MAKKVDQRFVMAGFGGQGIMSMGMMLTYAGMIENKNVSWLPSYGPEMRGGTANCNVIISDKAVGSPLITTNATCAVVMNQPSLAKFESSVEKGGILLINSSLVDKKAERDDIDVYYVPCNEIAVELGNPRVANMIMLGAVLQLTEAVSEDSLPEAFKAVFGAGKEHLLPINKEAVKKGAEFIAKQA